MPTLWTGYREIGVSEQGFGGVERVRHEGDREARLTHVSAGSQQYEAKESDLRLHFDLRVGCMSLKDGYAQRWQ